MADSCFALYFHLQLVCSLKRDAKCGYLHNVALLEPCPGITYKIREIRIWMNAIYVISKLRFRTLKWLSGDFKRKILIETQAKNLRMARRPWNDKMC